MKLEYSLFRQIYNDMKSPSYLLWLTLFYLSMIIWRGGVHFTDFILIPIIFTALGALYILIGWFPDNATRVYLRAEGL